MEKLSKIIAIYVPLLVVLFCVGENVMASSHIARNGFRTSAKLFKSIARNHDLRRNFYCIAVNGHQLAGAASAYNVQSLRDFHCKDFESNQTVSKPLGKEMSSESIGTDISDSEFAMNSELKSMFTGFRDILLDAQAKLDAGEYSEAFATFKDLHYSAYYNNLRITFSQLTYEVIRQSLEDENFGIAKKALKLIDNVDPHKLNLAYVIADLSKTDVVKIIGGEAEFYEILFFDFARKFVTANHDSNLILSGSLKKDLTLINDFIKLSKEQIPLGHDPELVRFIHKIADSESFEAEVLSLDERDLSESFEKFSKAHKIWAEQVTELIQLSKR